MSAPPEAGTAVAAVRLAHGRDLPLPGYATAGSAGLDLCAAAGPLSLAPAARALIPTGFALALPAGFEAQIRPRSGLALRHGVTVLNAPGTVDSDYRGEIGVVLVNLGEAAFVVERGMRIAQLVVAPVGRIHLVEGDALPPGGRGGHGFGSTGTDAPHRAEARAVKNVAVPSPDVALPGAVRPCETVPPDREARSEP